MKKSLIAFVLLVCSTGCSPASLVAGALTGATLPGGVTAGSMTDAELDTLIACAKTKGQQGEAIATAWATLKNTPLANRGLVSGVVQTQAKALGCR